MSALKEKCLCGAVEIVANRRADSRGGARGKMTAQECFDMFAPKEEGVSE